MANHEVQVVPLPAHGPNRSILFLDGKPARVVMATRRSQTAHSRLKVLFGARVDALLEDGGQQAFAVFAEFRLEMN